MMALIGARTWSGLFENANVVSLQSGIRLKEFFIQWGTNKYLKQ